MVWLLQSQMNFVGFGRDFFFSFQEYGVGGDSLVVTLELGKSLATPSSFFWSPRIRNSSRAQKLVVGKRHSNTCSQRLL